MFGRRRSRLPSGFVTVAGRVEEAKERLIRAVPAPRRAPAPLADSLAAFDEGLSSARAALDAWRVEAPPEVWEACRVALEEAVRRSGSLRLRAPALDFESLVLTLGDVMAPLDAFVEAEHALRRRD